MYYITTNYFKRHTSMKNCFSTVFYVNHTVYTCIVPKTLKTGFISQKIVSGRANQDLIFPHWLNGLQNHFRIDSLYSKIISALTHCTPKSFLHLLVELQNHFCIYSLYSKVISALTRCTLKLFLYWLILRQNH